MEDPTNLMMVTGVLTFDERIDFEKLASVVEERLLRFPRFRQRIVEPAIPLGKPCWEADPRFDLHAHLHRVALPGRGGQAALQELVSDLMSAPLDYTKPLWQFHLVEGYGTGCALLMRLHHAIADGIALVAVLLSMTDEAFASHRRKPPPPPAPPQGWRRLAALPAMMVKPAMDALTATLAIDPGEEESTERASPLSSLLQPAADAARHALQAADQFFHDGVDALTHPERALDWLEVGASGVDALGKLLLMSPDPKTTFKGPLGVAKRCAWSQPIPLDDVKLVGRVLGGTVNDVLVTAAAGALRRYLVGSGKEVQDLEVRAVVPVNLRRPEAPIELGNRFGLVFLPLPLGMDDPVDRLYEIKQQMDDLKSSKEAVVAFGLLSAIGMAPADIEHVVVNLFGSRGTTVLTNVPGPRQTISMAGKSASGMMFWVPQSGRLGMGISLLSYAGSVLMGVAVDAALVPDPDRLVQGFHEEMEHLVRLSRAELAASGPVPVRGKKTAPPPPRSPRGKRPSPGPTRHARAARR